MNSSQLECFLAVANTLNFVEAGKKLGMTQPAVSHRIQTLENELSVKLFERSTRKVALTREGEIFLPEARAFLARFEKMKTKFGNGGDSAKRPFKIKKITCIENS